MAAAEEDEGSSSWETDTDASDSEDDPSRAAMVKPVFVPKSQRDTVAERERVEAEMDADWERREAQKQRRAEESRALALRRRATPRRRGAARRGDARGGVRRGDGRRRRRAVAYAAWRLRELGQVLGERERRRRALEEREEQERVRGMSEEQKAAERAALSRRGPVDPEGGPDPGGGGGGRKKMGFLQKYYHKGAFFQERADDRFGTAGPAEIYARDFSEATGGDKGVDKSTLPKAMQVRGDKFGKIGQTKYTHLADQDTSRRPDDEWGNLGGRRGRGERRPKPSDAFEPKKHLG